MTDLNLQMWTPPMLFGRTLVPYLHSPEKCDDPQWLSDFVWRWQKTTNQLIMCRWFPPFWGAPKIHPMLINWATVQFSEPFSPRTGWRREFTRTPLLVDEFLVKTHGVRWRSSSCTWIFPLTTRCDGKRTCDISTTHNPPYFVNTVFSLAIPLGFMAVLPPFYHLSANGHRPPWIARCRAGTARPVRVPCTAAASPATRTV